MPLYSLSLRFLRCLPAVLLLLVPALAFAAQPLDRIIAVVNEDVVLASDLEQEMRIVKGQLMQRGVNPPPDAVLERQVLERLIMKQLQLSFAERLGIRVDDASLNAAVQQIARQNNLSLSEFRATLEQEGFDYVEFRDDLREQITIQRLQQRQVESDVSVSPQEVASLLSNLEEEGGGAEFNLGHILIATPEAASPEQIAEARAEAESVVERLRDGGDFASLAAAHSDDQNALEGGSLGWRQRNELPTLFAEQVPALSTGEVVGPIQSASGFHIIKLLDRREGDRASVIQTRARHILIRTNAIVDDAAARDRLESIRERLANGEEFATLARANSDDTASAARGGDLGWTTPGTLVPEFQQVLDALAPGEISHPFQSRYGWHLVQALERREHDVTTEVRRARATDIIRQRKAEEVLENWLRRMREEAYVDLRLNGGA